MAGFDNVLIFFAIFAESREKEKGKDEDYGATP